MTPGLGLMKIRYDPRLMIQNPIFSPWNFLVYLDILASYSVCSA
jgi:hypothetical protein